MSLVKLTVRELNAFLSLLLLMSIVSCQSSTPSSSQASGESRLDTELILNNAVLEQSNKKENTIWKIRADRIDYSEDQQIANLDRVVGNLFYNGRIILKISADTGVIKHNGNVILLKGKIVAQDQRNGSIINSEAVEWRPQENLLLIKEKLSGTHPNLSVDAQSGRYFTDIEKLEIQQDVVATTNQPSLQLTSDRLDWNIPQSQIIIPDAVKIVRYDEQETITDRLVSDRAEFDLAKNIAILNRNIELIALDPPLQIATNALTWNYKDRIGTADQPIQILDRQRKLSLTGNQGEINFPQRIAKLKNGTKSVNQQKNAELYARQLTWQINSEKVEATGNVVYQQVNPKARLTGEKAIGTLGDNNIVVTSNGKKQVTSVIDN